MSRTRPGAISGTHLRAVISISALGSTGMVLSLPFGGSGRLTLGRHLGFGEFRELVGDLAPAFVEAHRLMRLQGLLVPVTDAGGVAGATALRFEDRKSTRLNSSH